MKKQMTVLTKKEFPSLPKTEIIRFTKEFVDAFLVQGDKMVNVPIDAIRIVFKIASDLRNSNFSDNNVVQLNLFNNTFLNDHNSFGSFVINLNDIALNKNTARVKEALEFLVHHKQDWYETVNKDGKKVKSYGGVITAPSYMKGKTSFLISSYWLNKLAYMPKYNNTIYNLAFNVSNNKHMMFYFWLITLHDYGTLVNLDTLNKKFGLNYTEASDFCGSFLKSVKRSLDTYSSTSFNYSYKGKKISIKPFIIVQKDIQTTKFKKILSVSQLTHYWRKRHMLTDHQKNNLRIVLKNDESVVILLNAAYKRFIKSCKLKKEKATDHQGDKFIKLFHENIIEEYKTTKAYSYAAKGYPIIS